MICSKCKKEIPFGRWIYSQGNICKECYEKLN